MRRFLIIGLVLLSVAEASANRGVQVTPDERRILISADVGHERWAVTLNDDDTLTGNVYGNSSPDFLWCSPTDVVGTVPNGEILFACYASKSCTSSYCPSFRYVTDVWIPFSFFLP